jgi:ATP-binding cassette, subfamily B, bacterial PglK
MLRTFKKLLNLLTVEEHKKMYLLLFMMLIMALLDTIGVASILPFVAILTNPNLIETNLFLNNLFKFSSLFGVENNEQFLFVTGIIVLIMMVISLAFKGLTTYVQVRFVQMRQYSIGKRLIEGYLHQPYSWFLNRNSSNLGKTILSEVQQVVGGGLSPFMDLIAKGVVALSIIILLIIINPKIALIVSLVISLAYGIIFYFTRRYLNRNGEERLKNNQLRFTAVSEAFGAAKEVKVGGLEETYTRRFSNATQIIARNLAATASISQLPRFFLEALAFGGILLLMLYLMMQSGSFNSVLPIISLYIFAGYRLMPALQHIYSSSSQLIAIGPSVNELYEDLRNLKPIISDQDQGILPLNKSIIIKNVDYNYPNTSRTALKNINIIIDAKTTVGLVGTTGSGKTTTVDIILGLLEPQKGSLEIDGKIISKKNTRSWQRSIGYVPQHIYLSDDTIEANIAFGEKTADVNKERVENASKIANLHKFIIEELPKKYQTVIGERGVRLSGGQRQRIGIARALYYNPNVLVLDEATSALDNQTEKAVMDAVLNLHKDITIILIAHRLNTVKNCDIIFKLEKGQLVGQGTFEELINGNKKFTTI